MKVLVIAAHPDDDTIGCGGYLAGVAEAGAYVTALYVTDGSRSHPESRAYPPERLATLREGEARAALAELGIEREPHFLRFPDGGLGTFSEAELGAASARVAATIALEGPDLVLAPWVRDPHPDHVATADIAARAVAAARARGAALDFAFYEVWLPVRGTPDDAPQPGEVTIEIHRLSDGARERKRRALFAHRSQTSDLIADDPSGFRITPELAEVWLGPSERLLRRVDGPHAR